MNDDKYKNALAHARQAYGSGAYDDATLEAIFPELKESEDERIRKELKGAFEVYDIDSTWNGIPIRSIFAWLEKQKEQMPLPEDTLIFRKGVEEGRRLEREDTMTNLSYNELMELYKNIRDEIRGREDKK